MEAELAFVYGHTLSNWPFYREVIDRRKYGQSKLYLITKYLLIPRPAFNPFALNYFCPKMSYNRRAEIEEIDTQVQTRL